MHNSMIYGALCLELKDKSTEEVLRLYVACLPTDGDLENPMFTDRKINLSNYLMLNRGLSSDEILKRLSELR